MSTPTRDELIERLSARDSAEAAAAELRGHPEWLAGDPPAPLVRALAAARFETESDLFKLARDWDRDAMGEALWSHLVSAGSRDDREYAAFLLKNFASAVRWEDLARRSLATDEPPQVRRYLAEALTQLVYREPDRAWPLLDDTITALARDTEPGLRDVAVGLLMSAPVTEARQRLVETLLADPDEDVVASALNAVDQNRLTGPGIDRALTALANHASPGVRGAVERVRRRPE